MEDPKRPSPSPSFPAFLGKRDGWSSCSRGKFSSLPGIWGTSQGPCVMKGSLYYEIKHYVSTLLVLRCTGWMLSLIWEVSKYLYTFPLSPPHQNYRRRESSQVTFILLPWVIVARRRASLKGKGILEQPRLFWPSGGRGEVKQQGKRNIGPP